MSTSNRIKRPGPKSRRLASRLRRVESRNVTYVASDFPIFWDQARGTRVIDADGQSHLDMTGAFAVASLGHGNRAVLKALQKQARLLWHGMGDVHPASVKVEFLEVLHSVLPRRLSKTILSSSGSEAVESALKTALLVTGKPGVVAFEGAYHGLSYGTLPVTHRADFRRPFADQCSPIAVHLPFPDSLRGPREEECLSQLESFLKKTARTTAGPVGAILVEPVQGRGGVRVPKSFFLKGLREIADRFGILLIVDEIFTGFGRTGRSFGVDHSNVIPDLMCLGKALANGFPMSACIGTDRVMVAWPESDGEAIHTSTFLGNPLGCAMGIASIKEFVRLKLANRAATLGTWWLGYLKEQLGDHPHVAEIRGIGLMIGIELVKDRRSLTPSRELTGLLVTKALQERLLILSAGMHRNVLSLTPPLTVSKQELIQATSILRKLLNEVVL